MAPTAHSETTSPGQPQLAALPPRSRQSSPSSDTGWIRVTGEDRVRWLNGMVTNSIQDLEARQGLLQLRPQRAGPHPGRRLHLRRTRRPPPRDRRRPSPRPHGPPRPLHHHGRRRASRHLRPHAPACSIAGPEAASLLLTNSASPSSTSLPSTCQTTRVEQQLTSPSSTPTAPSSRTSSSGPTPPPSADLSQALLTAGATLCDPAEPRMAPHPRRHAALRHRHPRPRAPAGDRPDPRPALRQGLLPRPGDRRAHPFPRQRTPHLQRLPPRRRSARRRIDTRSRRQTDRRTNQHRRHPACRSAIPYNSH